MNLFVYHEEYPELTYEQRLAKMARDVAAWLQTWERYPNTRNGLWELVEG